MQNDYKHAVLGDNIDFFDQDFSVNANPKQELTELRSIKDIFASAKAGFIGNPDKVMDSIYSSYTVKPFDKLVAGRLVDKAVASGLKNWKTVQAKAKSLAAQYPKVLVVGNTVQKAFSNAAMDAKPLDDRIIVSYESGKYAINSLQTYVDLFNAVTKDPDFQSASKKLGNDPAEFDELDDLAKALQTTTATPKVNINTGGAAPTESAEAAKSKQDTKANTTVPKHAKPATSPKHAKPAEADSPTSTDAKATAADSDSAKTDSAAVKDQKQAQSPAANNTAKAPMQVKTPEQKQAANRTIATTLNKMGVDLSKLAKETENGETGYDVLRKALLGEGYNLAELKERLEENEDTVECGWCNELFDKTDCRKEVDLGYLCPQCVAAIKSRGEQLVFIENFNTSEILNKNKINKELPMIKQDEGLFSPPGMNMLNNNSINIDAHEFGGTGNDVSVLEECDDYTTDPTIDEGYDWDWDDYSYADPTDRECEVVCKDNKNATVAEDYEFDFTKRYDPENPEPFDGETEGFLWDHCSFLNSDGETFVTSPEQAEAVIAYVPMYQITDATGHRFDKVIKKW